MKVVLYKDEAYPVYYIQPKEQALESSDLRDIPKDLVDEYYAIGEYYKAIQSKLSEYWSEK